MHQTEDPLFEPWSGPRSRRRSTPKSPPALAHEHGGAGATPAHGAALPEPVENESDPDRSRAEILRALAAVRLNAVAGRLRLARHRTSVEDLLDGPARLVRFQLRPWTGPLEDGEEEARPPSMLEIGLSGDTEELVSAWYWIDRSSEAPDEILSTPIADLGGAWVEHVVLDFVGKVLERS